MGIASSHERRQASVIKAIHKVPIPGDIIYPYGRAQVAWTFGTHFALTADTALHTDYRPTSLHTADRPTSLHSHIRPTSLHSQERETTLHTHRRPTTLHTRERP
jgi:hypothetical protein